MTEIPVSAQRLGVVLPPAGRLTLTTAVPVLTADVTAATSIYYTPYCGNFCPIWNGTRHVLRAFAELTLALDSTGAHTGYHQSGKNFDLFAVLDTTVTPNVVRLGTGPAWTSDTARGSGAGTTELERKNGILANKNSMTVRFGSSSGNTLTIAADQATYLGSFRASADGQTQVKFGTLAANGGEAWIGLWNQYNRTPFSANVRDSTDSWTYSTATWRAANNSATIRCSFISGQAEDDYQSLYNMNAQATGSIQISIGLDGATFDGKSVGGYSNMVNIGPITSSRRDIGLLGFHFVEAIEYANTGTTTYYGDAGSPTFIQNGLLVSGRY